MTRASVLAVGLATAAGVLTAAAGWLRRHTFRVTVHGTSMQPTLPPGTRFLARRCDPGALRPGDIVVCRPAPVGGAPAPRAWIVKRVAALPGDPLPGALRGCPGTVPGRPVPAGRLLVVADNPLGSDSRQFGPLALGAVLGKAVRRYPPA